jgi:putative acetyltransferase
MTPDRTLLRERTSSGPARDGAGIVIRAMGAGDAEGINVLQNLPGYRYGTLRLPFTSVEETRTFIESRPAGHLGIVAEANGTIVGSAGLERQSGRRHHVAFLGMGVHDDHVGRGVGGLLLRALLEAADNWLNLKRLELTVYVDNAPALALYRRHGFEIEGTLRAYAFRDGAFTDAYAMARLRP